GFLKTKGIETIDFGTNTDERKDYPDYAFKVGEAVAAREAEFGILICYTGIGMSIAANKVKCIRAALCLNETMAELARKHNDANVLCLSGGFTKENDAMKIIEMFLKTEFDGYKKGEERHKIRVDKITEYETKKEEG
ncbi:MAG: RpiB/LacA/LacB family sugar-phosphate isomerase, partial [bacterium]